MQPLGYTGSLLVLKDHTHIENINDELTLNSVVIRVLKTKTENG